MKNPNIIITVGKESSSDEISLVKEYFSEFETEINNEYRRLSAGDLPMIVDVLVNFGVGVLGSAAYDLLKNLLKKSEKFVKTKQINRRTSIHVRTEFETYSFTEKRIFIQRKAEQIDFDSVETMLESSEDAKGGI